ncbi:hypothetical protein CHELA1G11_12654 [Hyphomicrobiales bacterium]|nr:hypothetical protein CHELA1G2_11653 [Hyphomicrobiales bacterium]CAH1666193.1 hypothetical protein CHELA1G11_12654 [Hyphomicrobiales bacterium]
MALMISIDDFNRRELKAARKVFLDTTALAVGGDSNASGFYCAFELCCRVCCRIARPGGRPADDEGCACRLCPGLLDSRCGLLLHSRW